MVKRNQLTEGRKMFLSVMGIFLAYGVVFFLFEDYDRRTWEPLSEKWDWHLLGFSLLVMLGLGWVLHRYSKRMDERISREWSEHNSVMRRELTQNIAHELKTPVASILGYMETLVDNPEMDEGLRRQFIGRSHAQAQRLTALLHDIATLNRIDYAPDLYGFDEVDLRRMMEEIAQETALALEKEQMELHVSMPERLSVRGNASLLYSAFRNLMDNAVNYAGAHTAISITAKELADGVHIRFCDNGVGVADEHLPRLFERFYRVDKGRSRGMGGTGLGLAIVKNAILLHGGCITACRNGGGGLCFEIFLKKDASPMQN